MAEIPKETDFIVVGAGVAGLRAAISLAEAGRVLVLAKRDLNESATQYAQGGVAVVLSDEDEVGLHLHDTIEAGDGIVNEAAAQILVEEGPDRIQELIEWGTQFDRDGSTLTFTREGAHSRSRVLHAHGDSTGREMGRALAAKAQTLPNISFRAFEFTADLLLSDDQRVCGINLVSDAGVFSAVTASGVLFATGGAGQVFRDTTNPAVATADGISMAFRAGAVISDMEFVQFHPTALFLKDAPRFLMSEALRGEGAHLLNGDHQRFMPDLHPMAELAPRDVVARAIAEQIAKSTVPDPVVYLDMRHLDALHLATRFPRILATCRQFGLDITRDLIPVRPAAHYLMGGVRTDLHGRSSLPGLYAAGETACTGVHGANRLASNSLLEGLVYGARAGMAMRNEVEYPPAKLRPQPDIPASGGNNDPERWVETVKNVMGRNAGVVRTLSGLREALEILESVENRMPPATSRRTCEAINLREAAELIIRSAIARKESRGAHYRTDFPTHDDANFKKHSRIEGIRVTFD
ncbi:MAG TPA: L-aspartate oxidase [Terriglobales bacterium]|nr:L-aspartate oxidase [Terriglobales bacterium]